MAPSTKIVITFGTTLEEIAAVLKLLIAAQVGNHSQCEISQDVSLVPGGKAPALILGDSVILFDENAAVKYLVGAADSPEITHWLEWERGVLRGAHPIDSVGALLAKSKSPFPSQAVDIVVFSLLFARQQSGAAIPKNVQAWFDGKSKDKCYADAVAQWKRLTDASNAVRIREGIAIQPRPESPDMHVPVKGKRNILITSALPYVNNVPHLGNIIGCVLSADVFARFCRLRGINTLYICGTDEYGTATETKALSEGISCQELCDRFHKLHAEIYKWFDIDFDYFGRTTTPLHTKISQDIFLNLHKKNLFKTDIVEQLFCEKCDRFLADRYVEGICPFCQYPDARGDQCDGCGKLLNSSELVQPRCKADGSTPITRQSEHMFLDLPQLQSSCETFVKQSSEEGFWSANGKLITNGWLREGLKPRCITRDLKWGTPVPLESMKDKVLYVWFDAPIGYLSISANYTKNWERWWKNPEDVKLYQFMGKDNVPFHTVIFPSTLLGTKEPYTFLHHLSTTEYLNYEGAKFSKSRGVGVFGNNVMDSKIPVEIWRFYLLASRPETNDSMFTWNELAMKNNTELLANLGNFINRVLKYLKAKFNSVLPEYEVSGSLDTALIQAVNTHLKEYISSLEAVKIRHGLKLVMDMSALGNAYLHDNKLDNTLFEKEPKRCKTVMAVAVNLIYLLSALISPYMPSTTRSICQQLNAPERSIPDTFDMVLLPGHRLGTPALLFHRIEEKQVQELIRMYGGGEVAKPEEKKNAKKEKKKPVDPAKTASVLTPAKK